MIQKIKEFFREVLFEVKRVTWPGKQEIVGSTIVVIVLVLVISFYVGFVDFILSRLLSVVMQ